MRNKRFLMVGLIMFLLCYMAIPSSAEGTRYWTYGMKYRDFAVKSYSDLYNSTWVSILDNSRVAWNNTNAGINISTLSYSNHEILAAQYDDTWYGLFTVESSSLTFITEFNIKVNARTISRDATNFTNFATSTMVHEFGHAFFLGDEPPTTSPTIMSYSRNRNTMVTPQTYDVDSVNSKYALIP